MLFTAPIEEVRKDYRQECIDRAKAARARMAEAAKAAERAKIEAQRAADELREIQRQLEIEANRKAVSEAMLRAAWAAIGRKLLTFEKKLALGPIAFRPAQPAVASRQVIRHIIAEVAAAAGVSPDDMLSARRTANLAIPRHFAIWRARQETPRSLPEIGRMFNGRDHTTIINSLRKIDSLMAEGKVPAALLATLPGAQAQGRAG